MNARMISGESTMGIRMAYRVHGSSLRWLDQGTNKKDARKITDASAAIE